MVVFQFSGSHSHLHHWHNHEIMKKVVLYSINASSEPPTKTTCITWSRGCPAFGDPIPYFPRLRLRPPPKEIKKNNFHRTMPTHSYFQRPRTFEDSIIPTLQLLDGAAHRAPQRFLITWDALPFALDELGFAYAVLETRANKAR